MADVKPEIKAGSVSFEEDPIKFCQNVYDEAAKHNEDRAVDVVADRAFYDCIDPNLEKRKLDKSVVRHSLYIPECQSAIDTRISSILDRGQEDSVLVRLVLQDDYSDDEQMQTMVDDKEADLNEQLVNSGFLWEVIIDWIKGSELQPLSIVKIGYEDKHEWQAESNGLIDRLKAIPGALMAWALQNGREPRNKTVYTYNLVESLPTVQWLDWDEFLYLPSAAELQDLPWVIHRRWLSWNDVYNEAKLVDWDMAKVEEMKESLGETSDDSQGRTSEEVDKERGKESKDYMKEGKYLIAEVYVKTLDNDNREIIKVVTLGNNKFELKNEKMRFPNIGFPFALRVAWPRLGSIEGDSSIRLAKPLQRLYNDGYNSILDAIVYGVFPPLIKEEDTNILETPKWGPASFIKVSGGKGVDGIKPLQPNIGEIGIIPPLIESAAAKIRQILNAPDVDQGIQEGANDEKATKTRLRVMGSLRRLRPLFKSIEDNIIVVAEMFIKINQYNDPDWILPVDVQVPAFSGVSTPDEERMSALMTYQEALNSPLYQSPVGQMKLRQLWVDYLNKARVKDVDERCPTEEELQAIIEMQMAAAENQAVNETINTDQNKEQEAANAAD